MKADIAHWPRINRCMLQHTVHSWGSCAPALAVPLPHVTPAYLANLTVAAFRGTKPVWNWTWNIFMAAICRESTQEGGSEREQHQTPPPTAFTVSLASGAGDTRTWGSTLPGLWWGSPRPQPSRPQCRRQPQDTGAPGVLD